MSINTPISPPLRRRFIPTASSKANMKTLKVVTWNVAALRTIPSKLGTSEFQDKVKRTDVLKEFFKKYEVDIACFQEHKFSGWDKLDKEYACVDGYDSFWSFSGSGYAGVVTYARSGLTKTFTDDPFSMTQTASKSIKEISKGRCMLTDHGVLLLLNIYAPNAGRGPEHLEKKLEFYNELSSAMARWTEEGRKVIITGDINTAHSELDIYNPKKYQMETGFLDIERQWITTFLNERKCKDVWREFNPGIRKYTFWDQKRLMREKNCGWRIDIFYANQAMMKDVVRSDILSDVTGSDHCPISVTFALEITATYPTPAGAGNLRKASNQQSLKSFFQPRIKLGNRSPERSLQARPHIQHTLKSLDKHLKEDLTRKRTREGSESSQNGQSDDDDILEQAFGVKRGRILPPDEDQDSKFYANTEPKSWNGENNI